MKDKDASNRFLEESGDKGEGIEMNETQWKLLDRRAFGLEKKARGADGKQEDSGIKDAVEDKEPRRCLACFYYPTTCSQRNLSHLGFTRCSKCISTREPCLDHY